MDINHLVLVGRLTKDAELKYTPQGTAVSKFSLASSGYKDYTNYFDVTLWGKVAESLTQYLTKGKQIAVTGELSQNRWTDTDGKQRSKVEVKANNIQLLGGNRSEQEQNRTESSPQREESSDLPFEDDVIPF